VPQLLQLLLDPGGPSWGAERLAPLQQPSASLQTRAVQPAHRLAGPAGLAGLKTSILSQVL